MILYRPVGLKELELIAQSNWRAFPPRLEHQPIFYPVLNVAYAEQIARDWNTGDLASGYCGFVTQWELDTAFAQRYPIQTVGAQSHQELWVPAEELDEFNQHIVGHIAVIRAYYGARFRGDRDAATNLPVQVKTSP
jgi:hypothetical protein